jgi:hypothetical protein
MKPVRGEYDIEFQLFAPAALGQNERVSPNSGSTRPRSLPSAPTPLIQLKTSGTLNEPMYCPVARSRTEREAAFVHVTENLPVLTVDAAVHQKDFI